MGASVGAAVAVAGVIGFAGIVVPHVVRLLVGTSQRVVPQRLLDAGRGVRIQPTRFGVRGDYRLEQVTRELVEKELMRFIGEIANW